MCTELLAVGVACKKEEDNPQAMHFEIDNIPLRNRGNSFLKHNNAGFVVPLPYLLASDI